MVECHAVSFMLTVVNAKSRKPFMLSVIVLDVVMMSVLAPPALQPYSKILA